MKRTFELPNLEEVTIWTPSQPEVKVERGGKEELRRFDSHKEAITFYRGFILGLMDEGAVELTPWLRYASEEASYELRVPTTRRFVYRDLKKKRSKVVQESFEDVRGALEAYNRFILRLTQDLKCRYIPREWSTREGRPTKPWREVNDDGRRYFAHEDDPKCECGPEQHLHPSGQIQHDLSQLESRIDGARISFVTEGQLSNLDHRLLGEKYGASFIFYPTGVVQGLYMESPQRSVYFWRSDETGLVIEWSLDGYNEQKKPVGRWYNIDKNYTKEIYFKEDGVWQYVAFYRIKDGILEERHELRAPGESVISVYAEDGSRVKKIIHKLPDERKHTREFYEDGTTLSKEYWFHKGEFCKHFDVYTKSGNLNKRFIFADEDPQALEVREAPVFEYVNLQDQSRSEVTFFLPLQEPIEPWSEEAELTRARALAKQRLEELKARANEPIILLGPWVTLRHPETGASKRLRLPVANLLEEEERTGEAFLPTHNRACRDHLEALLAYNARLSDLLANGWEHLPLAQDPFATLPHPGRSFVRYRYTPDRDAELQSRETYIAIDKLQQEDRFGFQRERYHDGGVIDLWMMHDVTIGWRNQCNKEGVLRSAQPMLGKELQGRLFNLDEKGRIDASALYLNGEQRELYSVGEGVEHPSCTIMVSERPELARHSSFYYRETLSLQMTGHFDREKRKEGQWDVFWPSGAQKQKIFYAAGTELYREHFDEQGTLTSSTKKPAKRSPIQSIIEDGQISGDKPDLLFKGDGKAIHIYFTPGTKRVSRAGYLGHSRHELYDEEFYSKPAQAPLPFEEGLSRVQALLQEKPSAEVWRGLCSLMEVMFIQHEAPTQTELLPVVLKRLQKWPIRLRVAPLLWINKCIAGLLPYDALKMFKALSLSAALVGSAYWNPRTPLLIAWLAGLPEDTPELEGLHLSFRDNIVAALEAANKQEPDKRFHAELPYEPTYHWDHGVLEAILQSRLARSLRVLDLSFSTPSWDYYRGRQGPTDGHTASLSRVSALLQSPEALEALDLQGNKMESRALAKPRALKNVKSLNLGQSHPIGDTELTQIQKQCTALEELDLVPNCLGWIVENGWPEDEDASRNVELYWSFYKWNLEKTRMSVKALKALLKKLPLRKLHLQMLYKTEPSLVAEIKKYPKLKVEYRSSHTEGNNQRKSDWSAHFSWG